MPVGKFSATLERDKVPEPKVRPTGILILTDEAGNYRFPITTTVRLFADGGNLSINVFKEAYPTAPPAIIQAVKSSLVRSFCPRAPNFRLLGATTSRGLSRSR